MMSQLRFLLKTIAAGRVDVVQNAALAKEMENPVENIVILGNRAVIKNIVATDLPVLLLLISLKQMMMMMKDLKDG